MAANNKDTIYIDIDDEITGIIDKLKASDGKIVAFVLPKRATVFQSIVNMKLLKRAADESKKHLVLITSEAGLLPLAGAAGVHVAKTLTSKPEIPLAPSIPDDAADTVDEDAELEPEEITADSAGDRPVGELAGLAAADDVETVELDNAGVAEDTAAPVAAKAVTPTKKPKKDSKLSVPNFERFRLLLVLGGAAVVLLIVGLILALTVLPKATIAIKTDATSVPVDLGLNLSTTASELKVSNGTVPAKLAQQQKTYSQQVSTTGQKNNGNKAQGNVTLSAVECGVASQAADIPAGTGVSANGSTFITQESTSFSPKKIKDGCITFAADSSTSITAQNGGASFNVNNASFSVAGRKDVSGTGSTSGGSDDIVQVVSQSDITNAKSKISANDDSVKQALQSQLKGDGYYAITATFSPGTPTFSNSANPGEQGTSVTVTETVTYTMFGARQDDLKTLLNSAIKDKVDTSKQGVLDDGLGSATYNVSNSSATAAQLTLATNATVGPDLNTDDIKTAAAGKKSGDIKAQLKSNPDVTDVDVKLSPFWVSSVPKKTSKITVTIAKPTASTSKSNASNP